MKRMWSITGALVTSGLLVAALSIAPGLVAADETARRYVPDIAGPYEINDEPAARVCKFVLKSDKIAPGHKIDLGRGCARKFPTMGKVAAWVPISKEGFALVNKQGKTLVEFELKEGNELYTITPEVDGITTIADISWRE